MIDGVIDMIDGVIDLNANHPLSAPLYFNLINFSITYPEHVVALVKVEDLPHRKTFVAHSCWYVHHKNVLDPLQRSKVQGLSMHG